MKLTMAENIEPSRGKNEDIVFGRRLIELGLFKDETKLPTGFGLRLRRGSGDHIIRNWVVQYRQHGRTRRMIVGSAQTVAATQALAKARKLLAEVELGGDPQTDKMERREKDSLSLRSVVSDYLAQKTGVKEGTLRMLRTYLEGPLYLKPLHGAPLDRKSQGHRRPATRGVKGEWRTHGNRIPLSTVEPIRLGDADGSDREQSGGQLIQAAATGVARPRVDGCRADDDLEGARRR